MLQLAIIGCGTVVEELYVLPLRRLQRAGVISIRALIDNNPGRIARVGRQLGCERGFPDLPSALAAGALDAVVVTSPVGLHALHVVTALEAGCHVFCEKPLTNSVAEARRMTAAARKAGKVLAVGMARRYYPNLAEVGRMIVRGDLGERVEFVLREGGPYGWPIASDAAFKRANSGGGVLLDVGAHTMDTLFWLFGEGRPTACQDDAWAGGVEANATVQLEFSRARGTLQLSWDQPLNSELVIRGERLELRLNNLDVRHYERRDAGQTRWQRVRSAYEWPKDARSSASPLGQPECYYDCFDYELVGFCRAILHGEPVAVDGEGATRVISAIEQAYALAVPMTTGWLTAEEQAVARGNHWRAASTK